MLPAKLPVANVLLGIRADPGPEVDAEARPPDSRQRRHENASGQPALGRQRERGREDPRAERPGHVDDRGILRLPLDQPERQHHEGHHRPAGKKERHRAHAATSDRRVSGAAS